MDVFTLHRQLPADYEAFTSGFTEIRDHHIADHVAQRLARPVGTSGRTERIVGLAEQVACRRH